MVKAFVSLFTPKPQYRLNWKPSPPDERDFKFSAVMPRLEQLPPFASVADTVPEVFDQGAVGSCTGNAGAILGLNQSRTQRREILPSRLMLYYGARERIGETDRDEGAYIRDVFKAWAKSGVCPESMWPYNENNVTVKPSDEAYKAAVSTLALEYRSLNNASLEELKTCIALGRPFEFGFIVYSSFMYGTWRDTMPMPSANEGTLGGHAVAAIGYDDTRKAFRIKNSWGRNWKDGGHFWMPYEFITNTRHCSDFWMLEKISPAAAPVPTPANITSVVNLKNVFTDKKQIGCLRKQEVVSIGKEMGLNTDIEKTKAQNVAIVAGGLGL